MTSAMVGGLFAGFMVALFAFVLLADQDRVRPAVLSPMRPNTQVIVAAAWDEAVTRTAGYLYPRLLTAGLAGVFIGVSLSLLGCPYPVTLAVWYGLVSQFLPMIGRYVAAILPVLVLGLHNPWDALWFLVVLAVWIPLQDYVIVPRLVVRTMALAPAIIAVSIGVEVFGPFGAFLALPAAAVFQSVVSAIFTRHEVLETAPSGSR
jgi:predicted PurR-regulated permease PerM